MELLSERGVSTEGTKSPGLVLGKDLTPEVFFLEEWSSGFWDWKFFAKLDDDRLKGDISKKS